MGAQSLAGVDFSGVDLSRSDLRGVNLRNSRLSNLDLSSVNLEGADLSGADLSGAKLPSRLGVPSHPGQLQGIRFVGANLTGADLSASNLSNCNLARATLARARLPPNLVACDLSGADLSDTNLAATELRSANLSTARLDRARLPSALSAVNLSGVDLTTCVLPSKSDQPQSVEFQGFGFGGGRAETFNVNLSQATLTGANLSGLDTGAVVKGCKFPAQPQRPSLQEWISPTLRSPRINPTPFRRPTCPRPSSRNLRRQRSILARPPFYFRGSESITF